MCNEIDPRSLSCDCSTDLPISGPRFKNWCRICLLEPFRQDSRAFVLTFLTCVPHLHRILSELHTSAINTYDSNQARVKVPHKPQMAVFVILRDRVCMLMTIHCKVEVGQYVSLVSVSLRTRSKLSLVAQWFSTFETLLIHGLVNLRTGIVKIRPRLLAPISFPVYTVIRLFIILSH